MGLTSDNIGDWFNTTFCTGSSCTSTYRKDIFPRDTQSDQIEVDMTFGLVAISDFNEVAGHLQLVGTMKITWSDQIVLDPYQTASPSYTISEVTVPQDEVWKPSITIFNSVEALNVVGDSSYFVRITSQSSASTANMEWEPGVVTKTGCSVDVSKYPWDKQTCYVIFTPWGYKESEVKFSLTQSTVDLSNYQGNEMWSIDSSSSTVTTETINGISYARFKLELSRKPTFFLQNMVLPIILLAVLNLAVFFLPADSGERVGYSVTVFLTFAVYLTIIADNLPKSSNPMSTFAYYMIMMLLLSAFICFVTIMSLRAYIRDNEEPVPQYLKKLVLFARCQLCKRKTEVEPPPSPERPETRNSWDTEKKTNLQNGSAKKKKFAIEDDDDDEENFDNTKDDSDEAEDEIDWPMVGQTIDIFFFFVFLAVIFLMSLGFLAPLAS